MKNFMDSQFLLNTETAIDNPLYHWIHLELHMNAYRNNNGRMFEKWDRIQASIQLIMNIVFKVNMT